MTTRTRLVAANSSAFLSRSPTIFRLIEPLAGESHRKAFAQAVRAGLLKNPKTLPWSYFYDEEGSRLFEAICELPEYYLTRTEEAILQCHSEEMVAGFGLEAKDIEPTIVELGSGSAVKTQRLIASALGQYGRVHYVPIDVSPTALESSAHRLSRRFPTLRVSGYVADYRGGLSRIMARGSEPRLVVFLGSSLGNYDIPSAVDLLTMIARNMQPRDRLLLGTDLAKDRRRLEAAYDDLQGITAAFNLNLLRRINRELGGDFDLEGFDHRAVYEPDRGRVEIFLDSNRDQTVQVQAADLNVRFAAGEPIHTENSYKYTRGMLADLARSAGFEEEAAWTDRRGWFQVQRWRISELRSG